MATKFLEMVRDTYLFQYVNNETRFRGDDQPSLLDLIFTGFSSTGVTIYCYFGLKFNDNTCCEVICKRRYNDNK
jgi:hypothetical protein